MILSSIFVFARKAISEFEPCTLIVFTDACKEALGFSIYGVQNNTSTLIFYKVMIAPISGKTLPSLELLAIYLALKSALNIISDVKFSNVKICIISLSTDSQISILSLLTGKAHKKNIFCK